MGVSLYKVTMVKYLHAVWVTGVKAQPYLAGVWSDRAAAHAVAERIREWGLAARVAAPVPA